MADEDDLIEDEGEPKPKGSKLLLIIALVNTLGLLGLAAFVVMGGSGDSPPEAAEALAESTEGEGSRKMTAEPGPTVDLGTITVNLREPTGDRYLKTKLLLELDSEESKAEVEKRMSQIRYRFTSLLSAQRVADVQGPDNMEALRKAMIKRANGVLATGRVVAVWPDEWIVQ